MINHKITTFLTKAVSEFTDKKLFVIAANSIHDLLVQLEIAKQHVSTQQDLTTFFLHSLQSYQQQKESLCCCLVASTVDVFIKEVTIMLKLIANLEGSANPCMTPRGSYFTANPLGLTSKIALVYPGVGSAYAGLGNELIQAFPELIEMGERTSPQLTAELKQVSALHKLASTHASKAVELEQAFWRLCVASISFSWLYTQILTDLFKIKADFAFGYSAGETSMLAALGVWNDPTQLMKNFQSFPTFQTALTNQMNAVRRYWQLNYNIASDEPGKVWESYIVKAPLMEVEALLSRYTQIYILAIHTDAECMIGGYPKKCQSFLKDLGGIHIRVPYDTVFHSPAVSYEYDNLIAINSLPLTQKQFNIQLFSSSTYEKIPETAYEPEIIGSILADSYCSQVNFPRLVNQVYAQGAKIFIEVGGRNNCSNWTQTILKGKESLCVPLNIKGVGDIASLLRALSMLISHGVLTKVSETKQLESHCN